jgi:hypothetical protein
MIAGKRPLAVTGIALLYISVGMVGGVYHFQEILKNGGFDRYNIWIEVSEAVAIVAGVFMLRRANWARWLAIAWLGFHVGVGALHGIRGFGTHLLLFVLITWALLRTDAREWFARKPVSSF